MFLYNTLTKKKEKFYSIKNKKVGIYICGPTVYNHAHIGNMSSYLFADLLTRYLKYSNYKVKSVMNITDIDDKIIKALKEKNKLNLIELKKFTEYFSKKFLKELKILDIVNIDFFPKATDYIPEIIKIIEVLIKKKLAYLSDDGSVYFKIKNFKNYGKLSGCYLNTLKNQRNKNNQESNSCKKEDLIDFVLWRTWKIEDGDIYWNSPWGKGRPGWHIECSAMSLKNLGKSFDIHTGAIDLIFPHHENEIAQSEGATEQKFVNYWLHREHLMVDGVKMSKSLGNFYTLSDILEKNNNPFVFRYLILINHYRLNINFTFQSLESANRSLKKIHNFINRLNFIKKEKDDKINIKLLIDKNRKKFKEFMDDDFNVAKAIASLFSFISKINSLIDNNTISKKQSLEILKYLKEINQVWGFIFDNNSFNSKIEESVKNKLEVLIEKRNYYRDKKEWLKADKIRDEIKELGFVLIDDKNKTNYKKIV